MGYFPPANAPSPSDQASASASAGFAPSPAGPSLCGFQLPLFSYNIGFHLPKFPPFPFPPTFSFFIGLSCNLDQPFSASFGFGGGRVTTVDPDSDPEYGENLSQAA